MTTPPKNRPPLFAEVAPAVPVPVSGQQVFTYRVPPGKNLEIGSSARIPFGKRQLTGIVTGISSTPPLFPTKVLNPLSAAALNPKQLKFAQWIAETMKGGLGYTLRLFLPPRSAKPVAPLSVTWPGRGKTKNDIKPGSRLTVINPDLKKRQASLRQLISRALQEKGAQVLVLVPEKSLLENWSPWPTLHAALSGNRLAAFWHGVAEGKLRVVIGTQKALFLPFQNLRVIVIEESGFPTHKLWDQYPRLDTRDGALALAEIHRASVVFAGSFASVAAEAGLSSGQYKAYPKALLPKFRLEVHTFTGADYKEKNQLPISLMPQLRAWSRASERTLLLYNRAGQPVQKLKHALHRALTSQYQYVTVTTTSIFAENPAPFKHVIWLAPELTFSFPDFRSTEEGLTMLARLQQLLPSRERIILATRDYALGDQLRRLDVAKTVTDILTERKHLHLPPFTALVKLTIQDKSMDKARLRAAEIRKNLQERFQGSQNLVRGPLESPSRGKTAEVHLLLLGNLPELTQAYSDLPVDRVDLSPKDLV